MHSYAVSRKHCVTDHGAPAGSILVGTGLNNRGLRVQIVEAQPRGTEGPIHGPFVILETGENRHAEALQDLLHRQTTAAEVLGVIRRNRAGCVSVVNANNSAPDPHA